MRYLIDGYNLLFWKGVLGSGKSLQSARTELIEQVGRFALESGYSIQIVFDAAGAGEAPSVERYVPVEVVYPPAGMSADEWLLEQVSARPSARKRASTPLCVLTNDKRLRVLLKALGGEAIGFETFFARARRRARLKAQTPPRGPLPRGAIEPLEKSSCARPLEASRRRQEHDIKRFEARYQELLEQLASKSQRGAGAYGESSHGLDPRGASPRGASP